jgi:hypothetical protein
VNRGERKTQVGAFIGASYASQVAMPMAGDLVGDMTCFVSIWSLDEAWILRVSDSVLVLEKVCCYYAVKESDKRSKQSQKRKKKNQN